MKFGIFRHDGPENARPGKHVWLEGKTQKKRVHGALSRSVYETGDLGSLADLHSFLKKAGSDTHLTGGTNAHPSAICVPKGQGTGTDQKTGLPIIHRTNTCLTFHSGPGLMIIDTDSEDSTLTFKGVLDQLADACPDLANVAVLQTSSSSSRIKIGKGKVGQISGVHTFLHVTDATDIPRATEALHKRLILAGHGWIKIAETGSPMLRSPCDLVMGTQSQPAFLRSTCGAGITQQKAFNQRSGHEMTDTRKAIPDLSADEEKRYQGAVADLEKAAMPQCATIRAGYLKARSEKIAKETGTNLADAAAQVSAMLDQETLGPNVDIHADRHGWVTVRDILDDPKKFHNSDCADPTEPDYQCGAKIYSDQARPRIHSFAHGGRDYLLGTGTDVARSEFDAVPVPVDSSGVPDFDAEAEAWADRQQHAIVERQANADRLALLNAKTQIVSDVVVAALENHEKCRLWPTGFKAVDGLGLYAGGERLVATPERVCRWMKVEAHDRDNTAPRDDFARHMVLHAGTDADTIETHLPDITRVLGIAKKAARDAITAAIADRDQVAADILKDATPKAPPPDPAQVAAQAEAQHEAAQAARLAGAGDVATDPLGALETDLKSLGVIGERRIANAVFLALVSTLTEKPISMAVKGQSSTGKSFATKAVIRLFPERYVHVISSMSPKSLIYSEEGSFEHRAIFLEEGEVLARTGGEINPVAEMLRVAISEGQLRHSVVERDPETGQSVTREYIIKGPLSVITTTTRPALDAEMETRLLSIQADETRGQTSRVVGVIGDIAAGAASSSLSDDRLAQWHRYGEWLRGGAAKVVIPFARVLAAAMPDRAVRARRDITSVLGLVKASAIANRLSRATDGQGQIIAEISDYRVALACVGQSIAEEHDLITPPNAKEFLMAVDTLINAGVALAGGWDASGLLPKKPGDLPPWLKVLTIASGSDFDEKLHVDCGVRELAKHLYMSHATVSRRIGLALDHELIEVSDDYRGKVKTKRRFCISEGGKDVLAGQEKGGLPTPDDLAKAFADRDAKESDLL